VLDGTDAVMLSGETAMGKYPVRTVEAMARICVEAERSDEVRLDQSFLNRVFTRIDQSIAMSALFIANHLKVKAIAALTQSGSTALWMSRIGSEVPIYALTTDQRTRYRVSLYRNVYPLLVRYAGDSREEALAEAEYVLLEAGAVAPGDFIVLTIGEPIGRSGGTNTLKIVKVGEGELRAGGED
jgi:pyruvate kinase